MKYANRWLAVVLWIVAGLFALHEMTREAQGGTNYPNYELPQVINLTIPPPSWEEWRDRPWQAPKVVAYDWRKPWRIGTLETKYGYLGGLPVERNFLLLIESGRFHTLYDTLQYQWIVGGVVWQPLLGEQGIGHTKALVVGIRTRF